ncbi:MAG: universal stress protein [Candidatus Limnocylindrales bacterium]
MHILVAWDGSAGGQQAAGLATSMAWPAGSVVRLVSVFDPVPLMIAPRWAGGSSPISVELDAEIMAGLRADLDALVARLGGPGRTVEGSVLRGRPASVIVDEARSFEADVVIVGSRGHGSIAALLLGSVSAEIVDQAPCPVLVARRPAPERVLFATDGSASAATAEAVIASWPIFAELPIRVVAVADVTEPWRSGVAPTMYGLAMDAYTVDLEAAQLENRRLADASVERLQAAGRQAVSEVRTGDAAAEIILAAEAFDAGLVVLGSRGRTGLARFVLGSVARNVVHAGTASVLIVREAVRA